MARAPWEVAVLLLAAASFYEIQTRGAQSVEVTGAAPRVDTLLLLFPILFLAGSAGLVTRALRRGLPALRTLGGRGPASVYLAYRRLAGASRAAMAFVTAVAVSVGILVYAGTLALTARATTQAKTGVFVGSDMSVTLLGTPKVPPSVAGLTTGVTRIENGPTAFGGTQVEILGVDPGTFARAAYWDSSFANKPLADLLRAVRTMPGAARLPAIVAGGTLPAAGVIQVPRAKPLPYRLVASVPAFPGMTQGTPLVVVDGRSLRTRARGAQLIDQWWLRGDPDENGARLAAAGLITISSVTRQDVEGGANFRALNWVFGLLQALGVMVGAITVGGIFLYLGARSGSAPEKSPMPWRIVWG